MYFDLVELGWPAESGTPDTVALPSKSGAIQEMAMYKNVERNRKIARERFVGKKSFKDIGHKYGLSAQSARNAMQSYIWKMYDDGKIFTLDELGWCKNCKVRAGSEIGIESFKFRIFCRCCNASVESKSASVCLRKWVKGFRYL